jgi:hypothetical protein
MASKYQNDYTQSKSKKEFFSETHEDYVKESYTKSMHKSTLDSVNKAVYDFKENNYPEVKLSKDVEDRNKMNAIIKKTKEQNTLLQEIMKKRILTDREKKRLEELLYRENIQRLLPEEEDELDDLKSMYAQTDNMIKYITIFRGANEIQYFNSLRSSKDNVVDWISGKRIKIGECKMDGYVNIIVNAENPVKRFLLEKKHGKPVYIVDGSRVSPGGLWERCYEGLEEQLFIQSSITSVINTNEIVPKYFPLKNDGIFYMPKVLLFADVKENGYRFYPKLDNPIFIPCIYTTSIIAIQETSKMTPEEYRMRYKTEAELEKMTEDYKTRHAEVVSMTNKIEELEQTLAQMKSDYIKYVEYFKEILATSEESKHESLKQDADKYEIAYLYNLDLIKGEIAKYKHGLATLTPLPNPEHYTSAKYDDAFIRDDNKPTAILINKFINIFLTAIYMGHSTIIMSAFGCYAADLPARDVVKILSYVLFHDSYKFYNRINKLYICIPDILELRDVPGDRSKKFDPNKEILLEFQKLNGLTKNDADMIYSSN